jgi:hypothetical protein
MKNKKIILFILIVLLVSFLAYFAFTKINKQNKKILTTTKTTIIRTTTTIDSNIKTYNFNLSVKGEFKADDEEKISVLEDYILNINDITLNNNKHNFKYINSDTRTIYLDNNVVETKKKDETLLSLIKSLNGNLLMYSFTWENTGIYKIINDKGKIVYSFSGYYTMIDDETIECENDKWNSTGTAVDTTTEVLTIQKDSVKVIRTTKRTINCNNASDDDIAKYCSAI